MKFDNNAKGKGQKAKSFPYIHNSESRNDNPNSEFLPTDNLETNKNLQTEDNCQTVDDVDLSTVAKSENDIEDKSNNANKVNHHSNFIPNDRSSSATDNTPEIPPHIFPHHYQEWRDSGIAHDVIVANLKSADGVNGFNRFLCECDFDQKDRTNTGVLKKHILDRYDHLYQGYWYVCSFNPFELVVPNFQNNTTPQPPHLPNSPSPYQSSVKYLNDNHIDETLIQAKPDNPIRYVIDGKEKIIKYEIPKGGGTPFIFLDIPMRIIKKVAKKHKIQTLPEDNKRAKWEWIRNHPQIPISITEGVKKAAALISIGIIAVASFSITTHSEKATENCSSWFTPLKPELRWLLETTNYELRTTNSLDAENSHNSKKEGQKQQTKKGTDFSNQKGKFKGKKREIYIVFDRSDKKLTSKLAVNKQTKTLGKKISKLGHNVKIVDWNDETCKGIDDYLVKHGAKSTKQLFKKALKYHKFTAQLRALATRKLSHAIQVNSPYFNPELIKMGVDSQKQLIALKSPQNTGKTTSIANYLKQYCVGETILNVTHRQSLSGNLSGTLDIGCYLNEIVQMYETDPDKQYSTSICVDSLLKLSEKNVYKYIIFDEVEQLIWHLLYSNTEIKNKRGDVIQHFINLIKNCLDNGGHLIIADADLSDYSVQFFSQLLGLKSDDIICYENEVKPFTNRNLVIYEQYTDIRNKIAEAIRNNERIIISTSGQQVISGNGTINLEEWLLKFLPPEKIYRVDHETVADSEQKECGIIDNLDKLINAQVIIHSNTISTGISLNFEVVGKFDQVFGIYWGNYLLDDFEQSLERLRYDCDRHVFLPKFSNSKIATGSANQGKLTRHFHRKLDMTKPIIDLDEFVFNSQLIGFYSMFASRINGDYQNLRSNFIVHGENKGYNVIYAKQLAKEARKVISEETKAIKKQSMENYTEDLYKEKDPTKQEHEELKRKKRKTKQERLREKRGDLKQKYGDLSHLFVNNSELFKYFVLADMEGKLHKRLKRRFWMTLGKEITLEYEQQKAKKKAEYLRQNEESSYFVDVMRLGEYSNFTALMEKLEIDLGELKTQSSAVSDEEIEEMKFIGKEYGYNTKMYKECRSRIKERLICCEDLEKWSQRINDNLDKWKLAAETCLDVDFSKTQHNKNKDMERFKVILNRLGFDVDFVFRSCDEDNPDFKRRYYRIINYIRDELEEQIFSNWLEEIQFEMNREVA